MFAASLPFPIVPPLPGLSAAHSPVSASVLNGVVAQSWGAHVRGHYAKIDTLKTARISQPVDSQAKLKSEFCSQAVDSQAKTTFGFCSQSVDSAAQRKSTSGPELELVALPAELLPAADAACLILGLEPMARPVEPQAPTRPTGKPTRCIAADALARIQVEEASIAWCAVEQDIPKRRAARARARAKAWGKWEGTAGALAGEVEGTAA